MPGVNWIPGVSQLKSALQLVTGDVDGALRTQNDFLHECPGVSQGLALTQALVGETESAKTTFDRGVGTFNNVANGIPIVGHVKSGVHLLCGDTEGASQAFQSANRSSVVMGTGVAAGLLTGGVGAVPAAIAAGVGYDTVDSVVCDKPKGILAAVDQIKNNPNAGNIFDATAMVVGDGLSGYSGAKLGQKIAAKIELNNLESAYDSKIGEASAKVQHKIDAQIELSNLQEARNLKFDVLNDPPPGFTDGQALELGQEMNTLTRRIDNLQTTSIELPKGEVVQVPGQIDMLNTEISALANEAQALKQNIGTVSPKANAIVVTEVPNVAAMDKGQGSSAQSSNGKQQTESTEHGQGQPRQQSQPKQSQSNTSSNQQQSNGNDPPNERQTSKREHEQDQGQTDQVKLQIEVEYDAKTGYVHKIRAKIRFHNLRQGPRQPIPRNVVNHFKRIMPKSIGDILLKGELHLGHAIGDALGGTTDNPEHYYVQQKDCNWDQFHSAEKKVQQFLEDAQGSGREAHVEWESTFRYPDYPTDLPYQNGIPRYIDIKIHFYLDGKLVKTETITLSNA